MVGWWFLTIIVASLAVLTISIYYLTHSSLKTLVLDNISNADVAVVNEVIRGTDSVTSPYTLKLSVRDRYGNHIKDVEINSQKSDYFYKNERIKIK